METNSYIYRSYRGKTGSASIFANTSSWIGLEKFQSHKIKIVYLKFFFCYCKNFAEKLRSGSFGGWLITIRNRKVSSFQVQPSNKPWWNNGWNKPLHFNIFLVFPSNSSISPLVKSTIPALYLTTPKAHLFTGFLQTIPILLTFLLSWNTLFLSYLFLLEYLFHCHYTKNEFYN